MTPPDDSKEAGIKIRSKLLAERKKELLLDRIQRRVEQLAYDDMDGPRPCMCMGGMPIYKGVETSFQQLLNLVPSSSDKRMPASCGQRRHGVAIGAISGNIKNKGYWKEYRKRIFDSTNLDGGIGVNKHNVKHAGTDGATPSV